MKILAIIPARAGSKRIINKNLKPLNGIPLIAYTIKSASASKLISKLVVSTDSAEIANISKKYGAEVPFIRPSQISGDHAKSSEVMKHAIQFYKDKNEEFDVVVMLQPTSPLRTGKDIDRAIALLDHKFEAVVSVCKSEHSPLWMNTLPEDHSMIDFLSDPLLKSKRSQDLPDYYRLNGAIYASTTKYFQSNVGFFGDKTKAYIMPEDRSVDIDDDFDFKLASCILKNESQ